MERSGEWLWSRMCIIFVMKFSLPPHPHSILINRGKSLLSTFLAIELENTASCTIASAIAIVAFQHWHLS